MSKRRVSIFALGPSDWMQTKPYNQFTPYDAAYLRYSNQVFDIMAKPEFQLSSVLDRDGRKELAIVLTCWYEDMVSEIGLWKHFTETNKTLHGFYLPFFDLTEYEPEDFNPEDIAYLLWHYIVKANKTWISPDSAGLLSLAYELYDFFEAIYDDAPVTDFYDKFLQIKPGCNFFEVKAKLDWLALQSYLLGTEMGKEYIDALDQTVKDQVVASQINKVAYHLKNPFLFTKRSSFLGANAPEWLAAIALMPPELKPLIHKLSEHIETAFIFEGREKDHLILTHPITKRRFEVHPDSFNFDAFKPGDSIFAYLTPWGDQYWTSGMVMDFSIKRSEKMEIPGFYAWPDTQQQQLREDTAIMEKIFHQEMNGPFVVVENDLELNQAFMRVYEAYDRHLSGKKSDGKMPEINLEKASWRQKKMGIYFEPGVGMLVSPVLPVLLELLQKKDLTTMEQRTLFYALFTDCPPELVKHLLANYPAQNLKYPAPCHFELLPFVDFLLRFFNPQEFRPKKPNMALKGDS